MRRWTKWTVAALTLALAGCSGALQPREAPTPDGPRAWRAAEGQWLAGQILVGYETDAALARIAQALDGRVDQTLPQIRGAVVTLPQGLEVAEAVARLNRQRPQGLVYAEPNFLRERVAPQPGAFPGDGALTEVAGAPRPAQGAAFSDPLRQYQWALDVMGAEAAWARATGQGSLIGVVDTGMDGTHPELAGKQVTGMDCLTGNRIPPDVDGTLRANTHATHVAGIAAAWGNNGQGIVGVAPEAQVMSLIIFNPTIAGPGNGSGYVGDANVARCILYAALVGPDGVERSGDEAHVLNNSWGGKSYGQTLTNAINAALEAGVAFVVSKGNSGEDEMRDPERLPGTIAVGATMGQDRKTSFSTMGPNISIGAPGENVLSSVPTWLLRPDGTPYGYQYFNGTSMAAPQVAGAIALLRERFPEATPYQLKRLMETTADDLEAPGYDRRTGWGRLNLARALAAPGLPPDGANVVVRVVTGNAGPDGAQIGVPAVDVLLRQGGLDRYFAQTNARGEARFVGVDPGAYEVIATGSDALAFNFRPANRASARGRLTAAAGGGSSELSLELRTQLRVTASWSGSEDVDLLVGEPDGGGGTVWVGQRLAPDFGAFEAGSGPGGSSERYALNETHAPYALYPLALSAEHAAGPVSVSVVVEQNGTIENYGPYVLQPGEVLTSSEWFDWWENFPDPERGFSSPGPGAPWVY